MADESEERSEHGVAAINAVNEQLSEEGARLTDSLTELFDNRVFTPAELLTMHAALQGFKLMLKEPYFRKQVGEKLSDAYTYQIDDIYRNPQ